MTLMPAALLRDSRALAALAVPLVLTQLAQVALTTTDTVMMGMLGTRELAAGGLALVIFNQLRTMGVGLVTSVGNQIAAAAARRRAGHRDARPGAYRTAGPRSGARTCAPSCARAWPWRHWPVPSAPYS